MSWYWATAKNISKWFFIARDRQGQIVVLQSHMDECFFYRPIVGPFFSVQEATKMLMRWS